jgi:hypothetical protein
MAAQAGEEDDLTFSESNSDVCCCGPHYDKQSAKNHQLLKVPRVTTDQPSLFLIFFIVLFMGLVWVYSFVKGQPLYLLYGMDWRGLSCGSGDLAMYKHQAWTNPLMSNIRAGAICVKDCPASYEGAPEVNKTVVYCICNKHFWPEKFGTGSGRSDALITACNGGEEHVKLQGWFRKTIDPGSNQFDAETKVGNDGSDPPCAYEYRTNWAMHKCVPWVSPTSLESIITNRAKLPSGSHDYVMDWLGKSKVIFATFMADVATSVTIIGGGMLVSVLLSLVAIILLRSYVEAFSKGMMFVLLGLYITIAAISYSEYDTYSNRVDAVPQLSTHDQDEQSMYIYLSTFIAGLVLTVLHLGFIVFIFGELPKAISIIGVASETFVDAPQILLYPLVHMASFICLIACWLVGAILLYSAGTVEVATDGVAFMEHTPGIRSSAIGYLYGLFWMSGFMNAMGYMIVAATAYLCTFASPRKDKDDQIIPGEKEVPHSVMTLAACIIIRYHMGTAAFGSLVFSLVFPLRIMTNIFGKLGRCENGFLKYVCCCCRFCLNGWESCFMYLNKMAYLQTVLHGFSFCGAAYEGLRCVMRGIDDVGPTTLISTSVVMVIKLTISLTVTGLANIMVSSGQFAVKPEDLTFSWVPYLLVFFTSYVICTSFMIVLETAIDAVMVAYCEVQYEDQGAIKADQLPMSLREHIKNYGSGGHGETEPLLAPPQQSAGTKAPQI